MMQAVKTAGSGLSSQQTRLDTIANNIANVNTSGYKSTRIDFKDALYTTMESPITEENENNLGKGVGVLINSTYQQFTQGATKETGESLDFAIEGDGFFTLQTPTGETVYTRNGSFGISHEADGNYLVNSNGYYVLDSAGNRISTSASGEDIQVSTEGVLYVNGEAGAQLGIVSFENPEGLEQIGGSNWTATEESGVISQATGMVKQGYLESSNVDLGQELTLMIRTQRVFSFASRALTTADEMDGLANNMR